jgi:hypothetical protein
MTAKKVAATLVLVLAVYAALVGYRGVLLVASGEILGVVLGLALLLLPLIGAWVVWREVRFGLASERLAARLAGEGGLPLDDLPRRPSGRIVRAAADEAFAERRADVEANPAQWQAWFRLGIAYDDAGDRRRAREAVRRAIALEAEQRPPDGDAPGLGATR